jgi:hypothetical protein
MEARERERGHCERLCVGIQSRMLCANTGPHDLGASGRSSGASALSTAASSSITCGDASVPSFHAQHREGREVLLLIREPQDAVGHEVDVPALFHRVDPDEPLDLRELRRHAADKEVGLALQEAGREDAVLPPSDEEAAVAIIEAAATVAGVARRKRWPRRDAHADLMVNTCGRHFPRLARAVRWCPRFSGGAESGVFAAAGNGPRCDFEGQIALPPMATTAAAAAALGSGGAHDLYVSILSASNHSDQRFALDYFTLRRPQLGLGLACQEGARATGSSQRTGELHAYLGSMEADATAAAAGVACALQRAPARMVVSKKLRSNVVFFTTMQSSPLRFFLAHEPELLFVAASC